MKNWSAVLGACIVFGISGAAVHAASKHNGACVGFAGSTGGYKYAGVKCYLDQAPGNYVIRHTVKERDDEKEYRKLLGLTKRPVRCTLTRGSSTTSGGMLHTRYKIANC